MLFADESQKNFIKEFLKLLMKSSWKIPNIHVTSKSDTQKRFISALPFPFLSDQFGQRHVTVGGL